jgi:uncharacterized damage-inducible protein DinB
MTLSDLKTHFDYNRWANGRLVAAVLALTHEQYTRPLGTSFPTIRETLAHLVSVEWVWLQRWKGVRVEAPPAWASEAPAEVLRERLQEVEAERGTYLATLADEDLPRPVRFVYFSGTEGEHSLQELLLHVVNHSTYHRGQLASMLRAVGAAAPPTDLLVFYGERRASEHAA